MKIIIHETKEGKIAEIRSQNVVISSAQDALDIMADSVYLGAKGIIIREMNLVEEFFNLRTGLAGDVLQKFSNYYMQLAIIGEFDKYNSKSLKALITESNRGNQVFFVNDLEEAVTKLSNAQTIRNQSLRR